MSAQPGQTTDEGLARREAADDRTTRAAPLTQVVRWALVALLVATGVGSVAVQPQRADFLELRAAMDRGDVTAYGLADETGWLTVGPLGGSDERVVVWRDRGGTLRVTDLGTADSVAESLRRPGAGSLPPDPWDLLPDPSERPPGASDATSEPPHGRAPTVTGGAESSAFVAIAAERGLRYLAPGDQLGARLALVPDVVWLLAVLFLLRAPHPRRATKWGWFWLFSLPLGLGLLWWLLDEHPWSRRASARPEPLPPPAQRRLPGGDPRITGGYGFVLMLAGGVAIWMGLGALGL